MRIRYPGARKALAVGAAATMLVVSTGIVSVLAVHDETFQLDGNVDAATTPPPANDWDSIFTAAGVKKSTLPSGYTAATFQKDFETTTKRGKLVFATHDATTFTTGSKDTLDINPGWQCSPSNNLLSKNDIMNAYAVAYTDDKGTVSTTDDEQFMYFGLERNSNNGDANVAFWFLQGGASCDPSNGTAAWSGNHADGDLLIVSAFTNGGGVSGITAYRWTDTDGSGPIPGFLDTSTPAANGGDCITATGGDPICATTNGSPAPGLDGPITTPWQTANTDDNVGNTLQASEFFEGGINLTNSGFGNKCFNTFVGDTRSSQSPTATIFDYASGQLGECTSSTSTQAKDSGGSALTSVAIPATGVLTVKDTATVNVTGLSTFSGTVQFYLCGPSATSITTCSSSGTAIGSTHAITSNGSVDQTANLTSAGYYCWHAVFSGDADAGVPGSEDNSANECFRVTPLQPTLPTQATSGPVDFGSKISDTVTPTGTANKPGTNGVGPGGTINATRGGAANSNITLTAYGPDSCSTVAYGPVSLASNGDNAVGGVGTTFEFTPSAPGLYVFVASLAADSVNSLGVTAVACGSQPSNEKVTVRQIPTGLISKQDWIPNDTATVSASTGNLASGGSVKFQLWNSATCAGTKLYEETVSVTGGAPTAEVHTNNTGTGAGMFRITTGYADAADSSKTGYSWLVTYTPAAADTAHLGSSSTCAAEHFSITYTNDNTP